MHIQHTRHTLHTNTCAHTTFSTHNTHSHMHRTHTASTHKHTRAAHATRGCGAGVPQHRQAYSAPPTPLPISVHPGGPKLSNSFSGGGWGTSPHFLNGVETQPSILRTAETCTFRNEWSILYSRRFQSFSTFASVHLCIRIATWWSKKNTKRKSWKWKE